MDNMPLKTTGEYDAVDTNCQQLSDRESLRMFCLIKRMILETMLQSNLEDLKKIYAGFFEIAVLKNGELWMIVTEVKETLRLRKLNR